MAREKGRAGKYKRSCVRIKNKKINWIFTYNVGNRPTEAMSSAVVINCSSISIYQAHIYYVPDTVLAARDNIGEQNKLDPSSQGAYGVPSAQDKTVG